MGMHLVNKQQEVIAFNVITWYKVLNLARVCGWCPAGTLTPTDWDGDDVWDGRYHSNDGQWITPEDARGIAYALGMGLDDIPDMEVGERVMRVLRRPRPDADDPAEGESMIEFMPEEALIDQMTRRLQESPFEFFSGPKGKARR